MWILPTLNRISKLENLCKRANETEVSTPCIVAIDKKDYVENQADYIRLESKEFPEGWKIHITDAVRMGDKVREIFPRLKGHDWVGLLNDDHEPITQGWDRVLLKYINGKTFVSANDRSPRTFLIPVTATIWSMPLIEAVGFPIYPERLEHLFIDNIWHELGRRTGCWRIAGDAIVEHNHVLFGRGEDDDTHKKVYNQEAWQRDEKRFKEFMTNGEFEAAVKAIKDFQDFLPGQQYNMQLARGQMNEHPV